MRRVFTSSLIICIFVISLLAGSLAFINSREIKVSKSYKDLKILVDITENRLYVISENKIIKSYPVGIGKPSTPSPIGDWMIISKDTWGKGFGGYWMRLSVPWGEFVLEHYT